MIYLIVLLVTCAAVGLLLWDLKRWADRFDTVEARLEESDRRYARRHRF